MFAAELTACLLIIRSIQHIGKATWRCYCGLENDRGGGGGMVNAGATIVRQNEFIVVFSITLSQRMVVNQVKGIGRREVDESAWIRLIHPYVYWIPAGLKRVLCGAHYQKASDVTISQTAGRSVKNIFVEKLTNLAQRSVHRIKRLPSLCGVCYRYMHFSMSPQCVFCF